MTEEISSSEKSEGIAFEGCCGFSLVWSLRLCVHPKVFVHLLSA